MEIMLSVIDTVILLSLAVKISTNSSAVPDTFQIVSETGGGERELRERGRQLGPQDSSKSVNKFHPVSRHLKARCVLATS